jgi:hypothetical protein
MSFNAGTQWNSTLKRRVSLRDSYRYGKGGGTCAVVSHNGFRRTRLKKMSKGHRAELAKYRKIEAKFLAQPENKWCICCTIRREKLGENILRNQSCEVHHWAGRIGRLLCYVPYFRAFCFRCRSFPHDHPKLAREFGLLAPANLWNCFPGNGTNGN